MPATKAHFKLANSPSYSPEQALVLIGPALDGPSKVAFKLNKMFTPQDVLGNSPLANAYEAAIAAGATDIILYRLNGVHATCEISYTDASTNTTKTILQFESVSAHTDFNNMSIEIRDGYFLVKGSNKTHSELRFYSLNDYPTAGKLVDALNADAEHGLIEFTAYTPYKDVYLHTIGPVNEMFFVGGDTESEMIPARWDSTVDIKPTLSQLKSRLLEALYSANVSDQENYVVNNELGVLDFGLICLVDMFHDDEMDFDKILGHFCLFKSTAQNQGCIGILGTSPLYSIEGSVIQDKTYKLKNIANRSKNGTGAIVPEEVVLLSNQIADYRSHVQIIIGDGLATLPYGYGLTPFSLAYSYAGTQASLPFYDSMTNKSLNGVKKISYELSKEDIDSLLSNGYISIVGSIRKGAVPYVASTYTTNQASPLASPQSIRISHYLSRYLADRLDDAIGSKSTSLSRQNLKKRILSTIAELLTEDIVKDYDAHVEFKQFGTKTEIEIAITPYAEIRGITSIVRLPFGREVI